LHESAIPSDEQLARGVPHPGILWGRDTVPAEGPRPADLEAAAAPGDGIWRVVQRGTNVWESIRNMSTSVVPAIELEYQPVDADHPPTHQTHPGADVVTLEWEPGFYAQLNTWARQGVDRTRGNGEFREAVFQYRHGVQNLSNFTWEPDGSVVRNYAVATYPGGERNSGDTMRRRRARNDESWQRFGIYGSWESTGQEDSVELLQARANAVVKAYAFPPDFFSMTVKPEASLRFGVDYRVGDSVTASARRGDFDVTVNGRIIQADIVQPEGEHQARVDLVCVPDLDIPVEDEAT
jgi:hypothetical protein